MTDDILRRFPPGAHPLVLAADPDGLLEDEVLREALAARAYRLVPEEDPLRLWQAVDALRPWSVERPILVVTRGPLEALPYDLWEEGHRVALSLADAFPDYAYPVVRALSPAQRAALRTAPRPDRRLGQRQTVEAVLKVVFDADLNAICDPGQFLLWLNDVHATQGPLPGPVQEYLRDRLGHRPAFRGWPLTELLRDRESFGAFFQQAWEAYIRHKTAPPRTREDEGDYGTIFDDEQVQDRLGSLVRWGHLRPVPIEDPEALPDWARVGVEWDEAAGPVRRLIGALDLVAVEVAGEPDWVAWERVARAWAEASILVYGGSVLPSEAVDRHIALREGLDGRFAAWLRKEYSALAGQRLPAPHHVYHVPHYLSYRRRQAGSLERVALLVLDGLALADWLVIRPEWAARHPDWGIDERLVLAQIPSITSVSRQALVGGVRPADLESLTTNAAEPGLWRAFWQREGLSEAVIAYERLALDRGPAPDPLLGGPLAAVCLVDHSVDELSHGASLGAAHVQDGLRRWLAEYSPRLEGLIEGLLEAGAAVAVASDHGHVQAVGMGRPNEGILADTRGQRCRVYSDRRLAEHTATGFSPAVVWADDGLLPEGVTVVMPEGRQAFTTVDDVVVTHGGLTIEEMVVPLVTIERIRT